MAELTRKSFDSLLGRLHDDPEAAGELFEDLRLKLYKFFMWRGTPELRADELADEVMNRVAVKLSEGIVIENLNAYAGQVARFVFLESTRNDGKEISDETLSEIAVESDTVDTKDDRLPCLRKCLNETSDSGKERELVLGYYGRGGNGKIKERRKQLAKEFGLTRNALKVRACRARARLERCIVRCLDSR